LEKEVDRIGSLVDEFLKQELGIERKAGMSINIVSLGRASVLGLALMLANTSPAGGQAQPAGGQGQRTLYERLGGYTAISAVVDDFEDRLFVDPKVGKYFVGMGTDTRELFKQKTKNLVCNVTGGPCKVISRTAKTTHAGLGITDAEFNIVVGHLSESLDKYKAPAAEKKELMDIVETLRKDIVER
jgi:hemoglobin